MAQVKINIFGAATTTLVAAVGGVTCKVKEIKLEASNFGSIRFSDGTADLIQGLTGAGVGAPNGGDVMLQMTARSLSEYVMACQAANRPLNLVSTGANSVISGLITYDMV